MSRRWQPQKFRDLLDIYPAVQRADTDGNVEVDQAEGGNRYWDVMLYDGFGDGRLAKT